MARPIGSQNADSAPVDVYDMGDHLIGVLHGMELSHGTFVATMTLQELKLARRKYKAQVNGNAKDKTRKTRKS